MRYRRNPAVAIVTTLLVGFALAIAPSPEAFARKKKEKKPAPDAFNEAFKKEASEFLAQQEVHPPVAAGQCLSCHVSIEDPAKLKLEDPDLCLTCHTSRKVDMAKRHPHAALLGGCTTCHDPHASGRKRRLKAPVNELCTMCHDPTDDSLKKAHQGATEISGKCSDCHTPHGSNIEKMLWDDFGLHGPFEARSCDVCHVADGEGGEIKLVEDPPGLCVRCHGDRKTDLGRPHVHPPFEMGMCMICHDPHHSARRKLLRGEPADLCRTCHDEVPDVGHPMGTHPTHRKGLMNPMHPEKPFGCDSCHNPHGSENYRFLHKPRRELCGWCHGK